MQDRQINLITFGSSCLVLPIDKISGPGVLASLPPGLVQTPSHQKMLWFALSFFTFSLNVQNIFAQSDVSCLPFYNWVRSAWAMLVSFSLIASYGRLPILMDKRLAKSHLLCWLSVIMAVGVHGTLP